MKRKTMSKGYSFVYLSTISIDGQVIVDRFTISMLFRAVVGGARYCSSVPAVSHTLSARSILSDPSLNLDYRQGIQIQA